MIHLDFNNIGSHEIRCIQNALLSGYVSTAGPTVSEFEKRMAKYLGVSDTVATNSGTAALHLALLKCGVGSGDEVIVPVLTFIATANAISYTGAKPIFVDVDIDTWCIDQYQIGSVINSKTKAIIGVNLYGNPCDWCHIKDYTFHYNVYLIEDAAESLGAIYFFEGLTDYQCYSFNGNKIMTTGGGGLLVGKDIDHARKLSIQAKSENELFYEIGYNYRMPALNAALGLAQLDRLDEFLAKKRKFNEIYRKELDGLVTFQEATKYSIPSWWFTACLFPEDIDIPELQKKLAKQGVSTRRIFYPIPYMKPYRDGKVYLNAEYIYNHGLCLPSSTLNEEKDILKVCRVIKEIL
jgi:perosamine synthetase